MGPSRSIDEEYRGRGRFYLSSLELVPLLIRVVELPSACVSLVSKNSNKQVSVRLCGPVVSREYFHLVLVD